MKKTIPLLAAFLLSACVTTHHSGPDGGLIQHSPAAGEDAVRAKADENCARYDKKAVLHEEGGGFLVPHGTTYTCE